MTILSLLILFYNRHVGTDIRVVLNPRYELERGKQIPRNLLFSVVLADVQALYRLYLCHPLHEIVLVY